MPYTPEHKQRTRARIVECARALFNRRGFAEVSIDEIMAAAGLTRGGFYNHFRTKDELYAEALRAFAENGRKESCESASSCGPEVALKVFDLYVSRRHLENLDGQCPLVALPSDAARAGPAVRAAYQSVLEVLVAMFEANLQPDNGVSPRQRALAIAATCVGAMVLARTVDDPTLADEICDTARAFAAEAIG